MNAIGRSLASRGQFIATSLGIGLVIYYSADILGEEESVIPVLYGAILPLAFVLVLIIAGVWIYSHEAYSRHDVRLGAWTWLGALLLAVAGGLMILFEQAEGIEVSHPQFILVNAASMGAIGGLLVGLYDYRLRGTTDRLESKQEETKRLNQRLTVLNRVLRHDIRNHTTLIIGNAELAEADCPDGSTYLDTIEKSARRMADLGDDARRLERLLHADRTEPSVLDLGGIVDEQLEFIEAEYPAARIRQSVDGAVSIRADPALGTALENLFENAIVHNDAEEPLLEVSVVEPEHADTSSERPRTDTVELRIADDGPGIPEPELEVFENGTETPLEHASGLGLWLADWIVEESGGTLSFESSSTGTVVVIELQRAM